MLDGLMFENFFLYPFLYRFVRAFASVHPHIFDVVIMSVVVKGDVFEVICHGLTENWMVFCESQQKWF